MNPDQQVARTLQSACLPVALLVLAACALSGCKGGTQTAAPSASSQVSGAANPRDSAGSAYASESRSGRRRSRRGRADTEAAPGAFDFYLLNLSWSPEFCVTHGGSPECGRGLGFVVHGMWPQDLSGDYPEDCSDAPGPSDPQAYTDIFPTASLVEHEWQTHGTCSGMNAETYFGAVRKAFSAVRIPTSVGSGGDGSVAPEEIIHRIAQANPRFPQGSIAVSCGNNRLTAIEICLTKDLQPESCQGVRSCRASVIGIAPR